MSKMKKIVATLSLAAMLSTTSQAAFAQTCNSQGCGYEDCCEAPCISPLVALGAVAIAVAIAVAVSNNHSSSSSSSSGGSGSSQGHGHSHS